MGPVHQALSSDWRPKLSGGEACWATATENIIPSNTSIFSAVLQIVVFRSREPLIGIRRCSLRFLCLIMDQSLCHDKVRFPAFASVGRECLFKMTRVRSHL